MLTKILTKRLHFAAQARSGARQLLYTRSLDSAFFNMRQARDGKLYSKQQFLIFYGQARGEAKNSATAESEE